jgi:hypothetical protein
MITVNVGGRERLAMVELRSDVKDRDEDGLVPTSFFRSVFVSTADNVVVFDARVTSWNGLERTTACNASLRRSASRRLYQPAEAVHHHLDAGSPRRVWRACRSEIAAGRD